LLACSLSGVSGTVTGVPAFVGNGGLTGLSLEKNCTLGNGRLHLAVAYLAYWCTGRSLRLAIGDLCDGRSGWCLNLTIRDLRNRQAGARRCCLASEGENIVAVSKRCWERIEVPRNWSKKLATCIDVPGAFEVCIGREVRSINTFLRRAIVVV
jgi:hypothetical protein